MQDANERIDVPAEDERRDVQEGGQRAQPSAEGDDARRLRLRALARDGAYADLYPDGYLEELRDDWPD